MVGCSEAAATVQKQYAASSSRGAVAYPSLQTMHTSPPSSPESSSSISANACASWLPSAACRRAVGPTWTNQSSAFIDKLKGLLPSAFLLNGGQFAF